MDRLHKMLVGVAQRTVRILPPRARVSQVRKPRVSILLLIVNVKWEAVNFLAIAAVMVLTLGS